MAYVSMKISPAKLRELIAAAGYNFSEFGRDVGVSKEAMRGYTAEGVDSAPIKPENLRKIAGKLGVSLDVLRVADDAPPPANGDTGVSPEIARAIAFLAEHAGLTPREVSLRLGFTRQGARDIADKAAKAAGATPLPNPGSTPLKPKRS